MWRAYHTARIDHREVVRPRRNYFFSRDLFAAIEGGALRDWFIARNCTAPSKLQTEAAIIARRISGYVSSPTDRPLSPFLSLPSSRHAAYITSSLWIDNGLTLTRHALGTRGPRQISIFPLNNERGKDEVTSSIVTVEERKIGRAWSSIERS